MDNAAIALGVPVFLCTLLWAGRSPKTFVFVGTWVVVFSGTLEALLKVPYISYVDEAFVVVSIVVFPLRRFVKKLPIIPIPGAIWLLAFIAFGLLGNLIDETPVVITALGTLLTVKGFALAFAVAQVDWDILDVKRAVRNIGALAVVLILCGSANLIAPSAWSAIFIPTGEIDHRFGLPSLIGPFVHPGIYAMVTGLCSIAILSYRKTVKASGFTLLAATLTGVFSVLAMRRRLWAALVAASGSIVALSARPWSRVLVFVLLAPVALLIGWDFLSVTLGGVASEYLSESAQVDSARTVMTLGSLSVANSGVLIGAGFGRYGSWVAALHYSPQYTQRGFESVYGLSPLSWGRSNWLTDTFWPAIVGESGWGGTFAFIMVLFSIGLFFYRQSKSAGLSALIRCLNLTGLGWLIFLLLDSLAAPTFFDSKTLIFFALLGISSHFASRASPPTALRLPSRHRHARSGVQL